jgi:hypothetical protein
MNGLRAVVEQHEPKWEAQEAGKLEPARRQRDAFAIFGVQPVDPSPDAAPVALARGAG